MAIIHRCGGIACPSTGGRFTRARAVANSEPFAGALPAGRGIVRLATAARLSLNPGSNGLPYIERRVTRNKLLSVSGIKYRGNASCAHSQASELSRPLAQRPPKHVLGRRVEINPGPAYRQMPAITLL